MLPPLSTVSPRVPVSPCPHVPSRLRDDIADDAAMHIREPELAALEAVGEAFVMDTEAVKNRGLKVVDVHGRVVRDIIA